MKNSHLVVGHALRQEDAHCIEHQEHESECPDEGAHPLHNGCHDGLRIISSNAAVGDLRLGLRGDITPIMKNQVEKPMADEM